MLPNEIMYHNNSDTPLQAYCKALARDTYANAYLQAWYPDRFTDIAFANTCFYQRIKPVDHIFSPSTRVMTALLTKINLGAIKGNLSSEDDQTVNTIFPNFQLLKKPYLSTFMGDQLDLGKIVNEKIKIISDIA